MTGSIQLKVSDTLKAFHPVSAAVCRIVNTSGVSIDYSVSGGDVVALANGASVVVDVSGSTSEISARRTDLSETPATLNLEFGLTADEAYEFATATAAAAVAGLRSEIDTLFVEAFGPVSQGVIRTYGDSITLGTGASDLAHSFAVLLASNIGTLTNRAVSGNEVADMFVNMMADDPGIVGAQTIMIGANDYARGAPNQAYFRAGLGASVAYATAAPNRIFGGSLTNHLTLAGPWTTGTVGSRVVDIPYSIGATASCTLVGTVGYLVVSANISVLDKFLISVDGGTPVEHVVTPLFHKTGQGQFTGAALIRFNLGASGSHSVVISYASEVVSYAASIVCVSSNGLDTDTKPGLVLIGTPPDYNYTSGILPYCAICYEIYRQFARDGANILWVNPHTFLASGDITSAVDPHPTDSGHARLAAGILRVL